MAIKLALTSIKGGLAKTTTSICLADSLQRRKKKTLLVDVDPQRSASSIYQASADSDVGTLADIMYCDTDASECIQHTDKGDIIASDINLAMADSNVKNNPDRFYHISDAFESLEDMYDYIIFDCPPSDGVLLGNVLSYVNYLVVPVTCDQFGMQGMYSIPSVMSEYTKRINPSLRVAGALIVRYKGRQVLTKDLEENTIPVLAEAMGSKVFNTRIRESVKCQEAQTMHRSLYEYAPNCSTAVDYEAFTDELLKELEHEG